MLPPLDAWSLAAVFAALALLASLRLSLPPAVTVRLGRAFDAATHPTWLIPLILAMGMAIGLMIRGELSPWPPEANAQLARRWGAWAGAAGFLLAATVDLWLLWTASMVAQRFARPEEREPARLLPLLNLAIGGLFLAAVYLVAR